MHGAGNLRLASTFRFLIAKRWWVVAAWALLLAPSVYFALRVEQDNSPTQLIVRDDPDYLANFEFGKVFGGGEYVLILVEAPDPFAVEVLRRVDAVERELGAMPKVSLSSALDVFRRKRNGFAGTPEEAAAFRAFITGTQLFRQQGLVGDHFLGLPLILDVVDSSDRVALLAKIETKLAPLEGPDRGPIVAVRKVGLPYVNGYLDAEMRVQTVRYFPVFAFFVIALNLLLYRSGRTLAAFLITIGTSAAITVGYIGVTGGTFTVVSSMVPLTVLITCTATLVYIQSRFVEHPAGVSWDDHQIFALSNKFLACSASVFATAVGFAALAVSKIRPVRQMGIWVAIGLVFTWLIVFTLFPALQRILRTPTEQERKASGQWFIRLTTWLPRFSYRWRWWLVPGSLIMSAAGAVAMFGIPHLIAPMNLDINSIEYINHDAAVYRDTKFIENQPKGGIALTEVWVRSPKFGRLTDPEVVRGLERFQNALAAEPTVAACIGPTTILRMIQYIDGKGDQLPADDAGLERITSMVETLLKRDPPDVNLARFIEPKKLNQTHLSVITKTIDYERYQELDKLVRARFAEVLAKEPSLKDLEIRTTGLAPLQAKIGFYLVPTLVESFGLTVAVIFCTFLLVFRNGAARIMAMIPSLFAILVMFGVMRLTGMRLNAATILIASTVLGTSENDQIHFFFHFLEKGPQFSEEARLRHTFQIAGRAIFFATLINACGFLAFALASLPPIRQFGLLSALAFALSMFADFTALPAALWMVFRAKPDPIEPKEGIVEPDVDATEEAEAVK